MGFLLFRRLRLVLDRDICSCRDVLSLWVHWDGSIEGLGYGVCFLWFLLIEMTLWSWCFSRFVQRDVNTAQ